MSSANCRANSHLQVRTSEQNPILRCPPLRYPPLGPPEKRAKELALQNHFLKHPKVGLVSTNFLFLSGTGDSQRDSRESIRANHSQLKPLFFVARQADSHESLEFPIRANHATKSSSEGNHIASPKWGRTMYHRWRGRTNVQQLTCNMVWSFSFLLF